MEPAIFDPDPSHDSMTLADLNEAAAAADAFACG
jgi:hypothetical protein